MDIFLLEVLGGSRNGFPFQKWVKKDILGVFEEKKKITINSSLGGFGYGGQQALKGLFLRKKPQFGSIFEPRSKMSFLTHF